MGGNLLVFVFLDQTLKKKQPPPPTFPTFFLSKIPYS